MPTPVAAFDRLGTETAFEVLARAQQLAAEGREIINLGSGLQRQARLLAPRLVRLAPRRALAPSG